MKVYEFALRMRDLASSKVEKLHQLAGKTKSAFEKLGEQAVRTTQKFQERFPLASRVVARVGKALAMVGRVADQTMAIVGRATSRAIKKMQSLRRVVASGVNRAFARLRTGLLAIGAAATLALGVATKESMGFNAQMSRVQAISSATGEDFALLRNKALEMGKSTRFSAKEAGEGLEELGRAGFGARDAASSLPGVLNLAAASGVTLAQSADMASSVLKGFQLEATESDRVADVLAKTTSSSATNMEGLAESFKYFMSTAQPLGITLEETAAAIGILGDGTLRGSVATNTLASGLSRLAKPTRQMRGLMKGLGIQAFDSQGKFIGLAGLTQELERVTANMTDQQKQATLATLFGANAIKNFSTLLNAQKKIQIDAHNATQVALMKQLLGEKQVNEALASGGEIILKGAEALQAYNVVLATAEGTAKKMAETMDNNLAGDITKAQSAFSGLMITIGDKFDPFLRQMTQGMTGILSDLGNNFDEYMRVLITAFTPLREAFGQFEKDLFTAMGVSGEFGEATSLNIKDVLSGIAQAVTFVTPFILTFLQNVASMIDTLRTTFSPMKGELETLLGGLRNNLLMISQDVWGVAGSLISALSPIIEVVINVANVVMANFGELWQAVVSVVDTILPYIHRLASSFRDNVDVGGMLGQVMVGATAVIDGLRPVLGAVLRILTPLGEAFLWLGGVLLNIVGGAFQSLGELLGTVFDGLGQGLNWLLDKLNWALDGIKRGMRFIGLMSDEADKVVTGQQKNKESEHKHQNKMPPQSNAEKVAEKEAEKKQSERLKKLQAEQAKIDKFKLGKQKHTVAAMSSTAFDQLITPPKKKRKKSASDQVVAAATAEEGSSTNLSRGANRITGGGSKQVNINITIGAINGIAHIENVNQLEDNNEVNQSADFIVQEIVRKINGALMVQEGI